MKKSSWTLQMSLFEGLQQVEPQRCVMTLQQLCDFFTPSFPPVAEKDERTSLYSMAIYKENSTRRRENVKAISGVVFDFDNKYEENVTADSVSKVLDEEGIVYLWHTTWSYTSACPRWRLIIPLETPCPAETWEEFYYAMVKLIGDPAGIDHAASRDMARMWFRPYRPPEGIFSAYAQREGYLVRPTYALLTFSPRADDQSVPPEEVPFDQEETLEEAIAALMFISADCSYDIWIKVAMALHSHFRGSQAAYAAWREWSETSPKYPGEETMKRHWRSFRGKETKAITIGTLFYLAKQNGWNPPPREKSTLQGGGETIKTIPSPSFMFEHFEAVDIYTFPGTLVKEIYQFLCDRHPFDVPLYALGASVAITGFLLRNHIQSASRLRTNFMILTLGSSGSGKTVMIQGLLEILECAGLEKLYASRLGSYQGAVERLEKNGGSLFLGQDEASYEARSIRNKGAVNAEVRTEEFKLKVFSCPSSFPSDVIKSGEQIIIRHPFYSEFSASTMEMLDHLSADDITKGLLPRYLLFMPTKHFFAKNAWVQSAMPSDLAARLQRLKTLPPRGCLYAYGDEEAQDYLQSFEECVQSCREKAQTHAPWDAFRYDALLARLPEHATKLALLGASKSDEGNHFIIRLPAMSWGVAVALMSFRNMERIIASHIHENQTEKNYARVLSIIQNLSKGAWIRRRDFLQKVRFITTHALEEIVLRLKEEEKIEIKPLPQKTYLIRSCEGDAPVQDEPFNL